MTERTYKPGAGERVGRTSSAAERVVARPRRIRLIVIPVAVLFIVVFAVIGALLKAGSTGVHFDDADQVSMALVGVALAAGILLLLRPRVRADAETIEVRNVIGTHTYAWSQTGGVSFPDGAAWARLDLPDDEYVSVMAIQANDGQRAVVAMRELRGLYRSSSHG